MSNSLKIIIGILVLIVLVSIAFWYNTDQQTQNPEISLDTPEIRALEVKECIEDTEYMRTKHMQLLKEWRTSVVRDGDRIYVATDGQEYEKCIQQTCLHCHSNREQFCDACHEFSGIEPNCWDCHDSLSLD